MAHDVERPYSVERGGPRHEVSDAGFDFSRAPPELGDRVVGNLLLREASKRTRNRSGT
jgi:hypothetical protein